MPDQTRVSYASGAGHAVCPGNVFDFVFSNPFSRPSSFATHTVPVVRGDKAVFVEEEGGTTQTWDQLRAQSLRLASGLRRMGLDPREVARHAGSPTCTDPQLAPVVLVQLPNSLAFGPIVLGVFAAGLTATLLSPALTTAELAWALSQARPRAVFTSGANEASMRDALAAVGLSPHVFVVDDALPASLLQDPPARPHYIPVAETADRTAIILWSSGTSGRSKGVLLAHAALCTSLASLWSGNPLFAAQEQRWLGVTPFFHVFGLLNICLLAPACGATVYIQRRFELQRFLRGVEEHGITFLQIAPPVAGMLGASALVDGVAMRELSGAVAGGAPLAPAIVKRVYKRLGVWIRMGYGLSEACSVALQMGKDEPVHGTCGAPLFGVELRVVDAASVTLPLGEEGQVLVRSPCLMQAYLNDAAATREALTPDGWLRTGDVGRLDAAGQLTITDRLKEMIKVKGYQVSPAEVEAILSASPRVADAAVVGVYDEAAASEAVRAYVVPAAHGSGSVDELALELRGLVEQQAAAYKWLRGGLVFVQALPRSPAGKILRRRLGEVRGVEVQVYDAKRKLARL